MGKLINRNSRSFISYPRMDEIIDRKIVIITKTSGLRGPGPTQPPFQEPPQSMTKSVLLGQRWHISTFKFSNCVAAKFRSSIFNRLRQFFLGFN